MRLFSAEIREANKIKRAQSFLEYGIMMAMVVAALVAMFFFFRNYTASRIRSGADAIAQGEQYEP
ncbi:MAG: hypothetical protein NC912_03800 [Candidatus Omnitrophica bacterium]|nr:hypothetical protein [Candidatus Omnitrophota bacterium]